MATIGYQAPIVNEPASITSPTVAWLPAASHCNAYDVVTVSAGSIATSGNNPANGIAGIIQHDSNSTFAQVDTDVQGVFGQVQFGGASGLFPTIPGLCMVIPLGPPIIVEINVSATTGWVSGGSQQANIGTTGGLVKDATTGFFFFDQTQTNAIMTIVGKVSGPFKGGVGDLGGRVLVVFSAAALAIPQGH